MSSSFVVQPTLKWKKKNDLDVQRDSESSLEERKNFN